MLSLFGINFGETTEGSAFSGDAFEEHLLGTYPIGFLPIEGLIDHHALGSLTIKSGMYELVLSSLEVLEIALLLLGKGH